MQRSVGGRVSLKWFDMGGLNIYLTLLIVIL
jgi:hypothetical protein